MTDVALTPEQWAAAVAFGDKRRDHHGGSDKRSDGKCKRTQDRQGAIAEAALAWHLGRDVYEDWLKNKAYQAARGKINIPCDVGKSIQVRSTHYLSGRLILRDERNGPGRTPDDPNHPYVLALVMHEYLVVRFPGWIWGYDGMVTGHWQDKGQYAENPAFVVPQSALLPLRTLPPEVIR